MKSPKTVIPRLTMLGRSSELAALLLDARWGNLRGNFGETLGLKAYFAILDQLLDGGGKAHSKGARRSFRLIPKAMELSWGSFSDGPRAF